jgi:hypothetical protein
MAEFDTPSRATPSPCLASERRVSVRYSSSLTTLCQKAAAHTNDFWLLAKVQDMSTTGARLLLGSPFRNGAMVDVEPIKPDSGFSRVLNARVVYCRLEPTGGWIVGCEFSNPLSTDELQSLL